jgi:chemotaxis protein CheD
MTVTVGVSEMGISSNAGETLITYALGSCVGLSLHDPVAGVGGLLHCMLPLSRIDEDKAVANPFIFVDTGVSAFLRALYARGAQRERLVAKVAGGSKIMDQHGFFNIGERNYAVLRKLLWKNNILISGEDVGGTSPRTMRLHMDSGKTILKITGEELEI